MVRVEGAEVKAARREDLLLDLCAPNRLILLRERLGNLSDSRIAGASDLTVG